MNQTKTEEKPTEQEIDRIDGILNKLDELIKQLPLDYQQDYAYSILDRLNVEEWIKMINKHELIIIKVKLVAKAVDMANNPDNYDNYQKGWVAGSISLIDKILEPKKE